MCSIGILMCVLFVNVFAAVEELWEEFETTKGLPWVAFQGCFLQLLLREEHGRSRFIYIMLAIYNIVVDPGSQGWGYPWFSPDSLGIEAVAHE